MDIKRPSYYPELRITSKLRVTGRAVCVAGEEGEPQCFGLRSLRGFAEQSSTISRPRQRGWVKRVGAVEAVHLQPVGWARYAPSRGAGHGAGHGALETVKRCDSPSTEYSEKDWLNARKQAPGLGLMHLQAHLPFRQYLTNEPSRI